MHVFQVGAGSGGMAVLDLVGRDPRVSRVTLVEPDIYSAHNVHRHFFPPSAVGRRKAELAAEWISPIRPDLEFHALVADITDPGMQDRFLPLARQCSVGICAADNEAAKFAFDALMRAAGKPWTLGEVLSGGIGGWVHRFEVGAACYGCAASYLKREVTEQPAGPAPDYRSPDSTHAEMTIPANKASIAVIAALHASVTLAILDGAAADFTSLLFSLRTIPGVFETPYRAHRLRVPRASGCLTCAAAAPFPTLEDLDAAVDDALARLGAR
jgi:hypothetical protein